MEEEELIKTLEERTELVENDNSDALLGQIKDQLAETKKKLDEVSAVL